MSEQPFYVGVNNPRFRGISLDGFLPALEVGDFPERTEPIERDAWTIMELSAKQWDTINKLRGMVKFLYLKETERRANVSKRKPIDTNKLTNLYRGVGGNEKDD